MDAQKCTPGPWVYEHGNIIGSDRTVVGSVNSPSRERCEHGNARLMAMAPELYVALARLITLDRTQGVDAEEWEAASTHAEELLDRVGIH